MSPSEGVLQNGADKWVSQLTTEVVDLSAFTKTCPISYTVSKASHYDVTDHEEATEDRQEGQAFVS